MLAVRNLMRKRIVMFMLLALSAFGVTGSVFSTVAEAQEETAQGGEEAGFNDWGLFGLLGLAGLAGLRRNRNDNDNRNRARDNDVDARRTPSAR